MNTMENRELSGFFVIVLPALAIPVVIVAFVICTVSDLLWEKHKDIFSKDKENVR